MLILLENICCDPSSETSRRDGSDEGSQHMVSMRNKKTIIKYSLLSRALILLRQTIVSVVFSRPKGHNSAIVNSESLLYGVNPKRSTMIDLFFL